MRPNPTVGQRRRRSRVAIIMRAGDKADYQALLSLAYRKHNRALLAPAKRRTAARLRFERQFTRTAVIDASTRTALNQFLRGTGNAVPMP